MRVKVEGADVEGVKVGVGAEVKGVERVKMKGIEVEAATAEGVNAEGMEVVGAKAEVSEWWGRRWRE